MKSKVDYNNSQAPSKISSLTKLKACNFCYKSFKSFTQLKLHKSKKCMGRNKIVCRLCSCTFTNSHTFKIHKLICFKLTRYKIKLRKDKNNVPKLATKKSKAISDVPQKSLNESGEIDYTKAATKIDSSIRSSKEKNCTEKANTAIQNLKQTDKGRENNIEDTNKNIQIMDKELSFDNTRATIEKSTTLTESVENIKPVISVANKNPDNTIAVIKTDGQEKEEQADLDKEQTKNTEKINKSVAIKKVEVEESVKEDKNKNEELNDTQIIETIITGENKETNSNMKKKRKKKISEKSDPNRRICAVCYFEFDTFPALRLHEKKYCKQFPVKKRDFKKELETLNCNIEKAKMRLRFLEFKQSLKKQTAKTSKQSSLTHLEPKNIVEGETAQLSNNSNNINKLASKAPNDNKGTSKSMRSKPKKSVAGRSLETFSRDLIEKRKLETNPSNNQINSANQELVSNKEEPNLVCIHCKCKLPGQSDLSEHKPLCKKSLNIQKSAKKVQLSCEFCKQKCKTKSDLSTHKMLYCKNVDKMKLFSNNLIKENDGKKTKCEAKPRVAVENDKKTKCEIKPRVAVLPPLPGEYEKIFDICGYQANKKTDRVQQSLKVVKNAPSRENKDDNKKSQYKKRSKENSRSPKRKLKEKDYKFSATGNLKCGICDKIVKSRDFNLHWYNYHSNSDLTKRIRCGICGKISKCSDYEWHLYNHERMGDYKTEKKESSKPSKIRCKVCHKKIKVKYLNYHMTKYHEKSDDEKVEEQSADKKIKTIGTSCFQCEICHLILKLKYFENHMSFCSKKVEKQLKNAENIQFATDSKTNSDAKSKREIKFDLREKLKKTPDVKFKVIIPNRDTEQTMTNWKDKSDFNVKKGEAMVDLNDLNLDQRENDVGKANSKARVNISEDKAEATNTKGEVFDNKVSQAKSNNTNLNVERSNIKCKIVDPPSKKTEVVVKHSDVSSDNVVPLGNAKRLEMEDLAKCNNVNQIEKTAKEPSYDRSLDSIENEIAPANDTSPASKAKTSNNSKIKSSNLVANELAETNAQKEHSEVDSNATDSNELTLPKPPEPPSKSNSKPRKRKRSPKNVPSVTSTKRSADLKPFIYCEKCGEQIENTEEIKKPKCGHSTTSFVCAVCKYDYPDINSLILHQEEEHDPNEVVLKEMEKADHCKMTKYFCCICGIYFTFIKNLIYHKISQHQFFHEWYKNNCVKPVITAANASINDYYACSCCNKRMFSSLERLNAHESISSSHKKNAKTYKHLKPNYAAVKDQNLEYVCYICKLGFFTFKAQQTHMLESVKHYELEKEILKSKVKEETDDNSGIAQRLNADIKKEPQYVMEAEKENETIIFTNTDESHQIACSETVHSEAQEGTDSSMVNVSIKQESQYMTDLEEQEEEDEDSVFIECPKSVANNHDVNSSLIGGTGITDVKREAEAKLVEIKKEKVDDEREFADDDDDDDGDVFME